MEFFTREFFTSLLNTLGFAWWVEIGTDHPRCTYYFGPFATETEATAEKDGYIEDLENEGAQGIRVLVKRCKPRKLTIFDEVDDLPQKGVGTQLSGQFQ